VAAEPDRRISKIMQKAQTYLEPGETVREAVYGYLGRFLWLLVRLPRQVVLTDRNLYVFRGGFYSTTTVKGVVSKHPIATADARISGPILHIAGDKPIYIGPIRGRAQRLVAALQQARGTA
jgi:hypothetical protein